MSLRWQGSTVPQSGHCVGMRDVGQLLLLLYAQRWRDEPKLWVQAQSTAASSCIGGGGWGAEDVNAAIKSALRSTDGKFSAFQTETATPRVKAVLCRCQRCSCLRGAEQEMASEPPVQHRPCGCIGVGSEHPPPLPAPSPYGSVPLTQCSHPSPGHRGPVGSSWEPCRDTRGWKGHSTAQLPALLVQALHAFTCACLLERALLTPG